jgi:hypothetical protein
MGTYAKKKKEKKTVDSTKSCRKTFHDDRDFVTTSKIVAFPLLVKHVLSLAASHR